MPNISDDSILRPQSPRLAFWRFFLLTTPFVTFILTLYYLNNPSATSSIPINLTSTTHSHHVPTPFLAGVGKSDITGPVVEINLMGYADPAQIGTGLRQRLYARAFIITSAANPTRCLAYLVLDTQSGDTAVRAGILQGLKRQGGDIARLYGAQNMAVTGTHSHAGPGAWLNYLLPQITSKGFDKQSYEAIVSGSVAAIVTAHQRLAPVHLSVGTTELRDASINRSLFAYLANPEAERARYNRTGDPKYPPLPPTHHDNGGNIDGSVDTNMTLLHLQRASDNKTIGALTWFPTHGTSLLGNNTLIAGDNKGVAASLLEKTLHLHSPETVAQDFVAGFSQASVGDKCHARGPFFQETDSGASSCYEIGRRQFEAAKTILDKPDEMHRIVGDSDVRAFHVFHDMANFEFDSVDSSGIQKLLKTCPAALGYSFAAGTSDGPGAFDFTQNDSNGQKSPVWKVVSHFLQSPGPDQRDCHAPKPILLDVGEVARPYPWTPNIVDIQVLRIGNFAKIVSPGEATTMAGRRWREAIKQETTAHLGTDVDVVLGGPANSYTHYITTPEEYAVQRYEGASTLYGQHTLSAYINRTLTFLPLLFNETHHEASTILGPSPPDNRNSSLNFITPVIVDHAPLDHSFGHVVTDILSPAYRPGETVSATFVAANPRNNLRLGSTFTAVERQVNPYTDSWVTVRDDSDWNLTFHWIRKSTILGMSEATVKWNIEHHAEPGRYRLRYFGDSRGFRGAVTDFSGQSTAFDVL